MRFLFNLVVLLNLIVLDVVVIALLVLGLGYLGFVPQVSKALGTDRPRDLGVRITQGDIQSATEKARVAVFALPSGAAPKESLTLSGSVPVSSSFTDRELTALIASHESKWKHYPISECQIKIADDGTVEAAGILAMDRVHEYAAATGIPPEVVNAVVDRLKITNTNPPFFVRGTLAVTDGKVSGDVFQAEIGRVPVPPNMIAENKQDVVAFVENRIAAAGITAKSVTFANGGMKFEGTVPESVGMSPR